MKKMLAPLSVILMLFACQEQRQTTTNKFDSFDQFLSDEVQAGRLVGVQGIVWHDGQLVYNKTYGLRDRESGDSMRGDELFFIQSMTKPIVSAALMTLYDEGRFQLDDPISQYLPEFAASVVVNDPTIGSSSGTHPAPSAMTIRQLLSHTAGMTHGIAPITYDKEIWDGILRNPNIKTLADRVTALSQKPLIFDPGLRWHYSFSPDLVGRLVEVLSGKDLSTFLQERIFTPLGMQNSGYNLSAAQQQRVMTVYAFGADSTLQRLENQPKSSGNTLYSGVNALFTTAADYLSFAGMMLNRGEWKGKRILKPETVDLMATDHTGSVKFKLDTTNQYAKRSVAIVADSLGALGLEPGYGFGLGFAIMQDPAKADRTAATKGEYFWSGANSTHFLINPNKRLVAVFMTQVASVGTPNPYGFYFGNTMRSSIYKEFE
jgi:CubicO group peptidase (beta-lactamase class C family)